MDKILKSLREFWEKTSPFREKTAKVFKGIGNGFQMVWKWVYRLRSVLLAIPVGTAAVILALRNAVSLPERVGLDLQASGEHALIVDRSLAVMGPLAITAVCLLLMFSSRRVLYPWLVSLFSLVLPILLLITNVFTG
jgi:hypothetical protein